MRTTPSRGRVSGWRPEDLALLAGTFGSDPASTRGCHSPAGQPPGASLPIAGLYVRRYFSLGGMPGRLTNMKQRVRCHSVRRLNSLLSDIAFSPFHSAIGVTLQRTARDPREEAGCAPSEHGLPSADRLLGGSPVSIWQSLRSSRAFRSSLARSKSSDTRMPTVRSLRSKAL